MSGFIFKGHAAIHDPFPLGYSMIHFGTIIQADNISGKQPWIPSCFANDTTLFSIASHFINYYDPMDNLENDDFRQFALGFWLNFRYVGIKGAGVFFHALKIYEEQKGYLSLSTDVIPYVTISVEFEAFRAGLSEYKNESETLLTTGFSLWIPWSFAATSLTCKNIPLEDASHEGFRQEVSFSLGIHTKPHRFGAQGVLINYGPETKDLRLFIGEEIKIHQNIALGAGISVRPIMISFGFTFNLTTYNIFAALVHHPVLGWSRGIGMAYSK